MSKTRLSPKACGVREQKQSDPSVKAEFRAWPLLNVLKVTAFFSSYVFISSCPMPEFESVSNLVLKAVHWLCLDSVWRCNGWSIPVIPRIAYSGHHSCQRLPLCSTYWHVGYHKFPPVLRKEDGSENTYVVLGSVFYVCLKSFMWALQTECSARWRWKNSQKHLRSQKLAFYSFLFCRRPVKLCLWGRSLRKQCQRTSSLA